MRAWLRFAYFRNGWHNHFMDHEWKICFANFLFFVMSGAGLAFAGFDKNPLVADPLPPLFEDLGPAAIGLPASMPPPKTKPLNLTSEISAGRRGVPVSPATRKQLLNAIEVGDLERAKRLLIGLNINAQDNRGITPLYKAVFHNRFSFVRLLLKRGADINLPDHEGLTPLHVSALEDLDKLMPVLLDQGAELEAKDSYGYTPLHLAADQGNSKVGRVLIERGANVNNRSDWGSTPLHSSIAQGNIQLVKLLLKKGADIGAKDRLGRSALHWAAEKGHLSTAKFLILNGAPIHHLDNDGQTPLHEAARWDQQKIVKLFIFHGANVNYKRSRRSGTTSYCYHQRKYGYCQPA